MQASKSRHNILSKHNHDSIPEVPLNIIGSVSKSKFASEPVDISAPVNSNLTTEARRKVATEKLKEKLRKRQEQKKFHASLDHETNSLDETMSVAASVASGDSLEETAVMNRKKEIFDRIHTPIKSFNQRLLRAALYYSVHVV